MQESKCFPVGRMSSSIQTFSDFGNIFGNMNHSKIREALTLKWDFHIERLTTIFLESIFDPGLLAWTQNTSNPLS